MHIASGQHGGTHGNRALLHYTVPRSLAHVERFVGEVFTAAVGFATEAPTQCGVVMTGNDCPPNWVGR